MSYGNDALYGFAAHDPRRATAQATPLRSRALPQSVLGHVALAFVATTCLWTVYTQLGANDAATLADRFAAVPAEVWTKPAQRMPLPRQTIVQKTSAAIHKGFAGLFDARTLSVAPGALSRGEPARLADHLAPASGAAAFKSQTRLASAPAEPQTAERGSSPSRRPTAVASVPTPSAPAALAPKGPVEDKATVLALISSNKNSLFNKLFGKPKPEATTLAYASADGGVLSEKQTILFDGMPKYDQYTAVYDISARKVYLPDGTELEAHSGLGKKMDDPRNVHVKMHGSTPPHVYDLTMREALFHGVEAIRLTPVGGSERIFGRTGLLAHTYMLGPRGDSNGCVSFRNYDAFLQAFKKGLVRRMVVVARLA